MKFKAKVTVEIIHTIEVDENVWLSPLNRINAILPDVINGVIHDPHTPSVEVIVSEPDIQEYVEPVVVKHKKVDNKPVNVNKNTKNDEKV